MGQIKMKTAMAILQGERARARMASLDMEIKAAQDEEREADQALREFQEAVAMGARLASVSAKVADQRKVTTQAESDRQKLAGEVADDKRHLEALDALRAAELDLKSADTVMASQYAKTEYDATVAMLQEAHRQFDAGNWDQALARAVTASGEAASAIDAARPRYEEAEQANAAALRDRALEQAAAGIAGIETRLERQKDLQKLVLVLRHLFLQHRSSFSPQGAKALDAVEKLLASFPTYPVRISGFTERTEGHRHVLSSSLTRANDVYWALVARGLDPRRISLDTDGTVSEEPNGPRTGMEPDDSVEIAILYHAKKS
jgi:outer membrane protein OmpA-like peptidoglycan-associated protein